MNIINNVKWVSLSQLVRVSCQIFGMFFFSRFLSPREIGLMSLALIVVTFINMLRDLGSSAAIIQKEVISEELKKSVFTLNVSLGMIFYILVISLSGVFATFFGEPQIQSILIWVALAFPLTSCTSIHLSLLERESLFFKTAKIEIASAIIALTCGICAALLGCGVYSLVIQTLANAVFSTCGFLFTSNWKSRFGWSRKEIGTIIRFSSNMVGFNFINYFSRNLDQIIIGKFFGTVSLGFYSLAYRLMLFPLQNITSVLTRSLYPVLSRLQDQNKEAISIYLGALRFISLVIPPLMFGLAAVRFDFVTVFFGQKWLGVADILMWLTPTAILQSMVSTTGSAFMSKGRSDLLLKISIFNAILQMLSFIVGAAFDVVTLTKLYFVANLIMYFPNMSLAINLFGGNIMMIVKYTYKPIFSAVAMFIVISVLQASSYFINMSTQNRLLICVCIGAVIYSLMVFLLDRKYLLSKITEIVKLKSSN